MKQKAKTAEPVENAPAEVMPEASTLPRCPNCGWQNVRLSKSNGFDHVISAFHLKPFRCRSCGHRFYRFYRVPA
jgi:DNA-directed RNA polymerase subunit RPC12/RpoP